MTVETSRSISTKVWGRAEIKLFVILVLYPSVNNAASNESFNHNYVTMITGKWDDMGHLCRKLL